MLKITNIAEPIQLIKKSVPAKKRITTPKIKFNVRKTALISTAACFSVVALAFAFSRFADYTPSEFEMAQAQAPFASESAAEAASPNPAPPRTMSLATDGAGAGQRLASDSAVAESVGEEAAESQAAKSAQTMIQDFTTKEFHIQIEVDDYEKAIEKINALEGFNSSINIRYTDSNEIQTAAIVKRVPADKYYSYRAQLRVLGDVSYENESQRQIGYQYLDDEARLKSKQAEAERLVALLQKSQSLSVMVAIEKNLSLVEEQKNSYTSNLIRFDNQLNSPYLYIDIVQRRVSPPVKQIVTLPQKMANAFKVSLNMIVSFFEFILVFISGVFIPSVIAVLLVFVLFVSIRFVNKPKRRDNHE